MEILTFFSPFFSLSNRFDSKLIAVSFFSSLFFSHLSRSVSFYLWTTNKSDESSSITYLNWRILSIICALLFERCSVRRKRNETERTINRLVRHRLLVVPTVGIESNLSIVANSKNYRASRLLIRGESSTNWKRRRLGMEESELGR